MRDEIALWLPRDDEHARAAALGLCGADRERHEQTVLQAQRELAAATPGIRVRVYQWTVDEVVAAMRDAGLENKPQGRANAFARLAAKSRRQDA